MIWLVMIDASKTLCIVIYSLSPTTLYTCGTCTHCRCANASSLKTAKYVIPTEQAPWTCASAHTFARGGKKKKKYSYKCWKCSAVPPVESYYLLAVGRGKKHLLFAGFWLGQNNTTRMQVHTVMRVILAHAYTIVMPLCFLFICFLFFFLTALPVNFLMSSRSAACYCDAVMTSFRSHVYSRGGCYNMFCNTWPKHCRAFR